MSKTPGIDKEKIIESLNPHERKILPLLDEKNIDALSKKTDLDKASIIRALEFLSNKKLVIIKTSTEKIVDLGVNGILYSRQGLPERRLINLIAEKKNKSLEEKIIEILKKKFEELSPEERYAFENLKNRKEIVEIQDKKSIHIELTELGKIIMKEKLTGEYIESITPEMIKNTGWVGKKFRRYDITSPVPRIHGGKRHFVNQAIDYAKKIWLEMGFKEMDGELIQSGFYNFDALFTAQDHPVREMQDTFFIKEHIANLPDKKIVQQIKNAHEGKINGSKGWAYNWKEEDAKKVLLRTHTTCLSIKKLIDIQKNKEFPAKYFAFTEPSLEIDVYHSVHKKWIEFGGAGMFRPEVTIPIFGEHIPVLAWGPGFDRIIMEYFEITDLRELYKNDIDKLRDMKVWRK